MSIFQDVRGALTTQANTATGLPSARAYEGLPFNPVTGTPYVAYTLIPTQERPSSLGQAGMTLRQGLFQVSLFYPAGSGTGTMESVGDAVKDKFVPGNVLTQGTTNVRVRYAERNAPIIQHPDFLQLVITVGFDLHTPTTP